MIYRVTIINMPPKPKGTGKKSAKDKAAEKVISEVNGIDDMSIHRLLSTVYGGGGGEEGREEDIDLSDSKSILESLVPALIFLCEKVNKLEGLLRERGREEGTFAEEGEAVGGEGEAAGGVGGGGRGLQHRVRMQEDELDEARQRNLKGNLILTSSAKGGHTCVIKDDVTLQRENTRLLDHAIELVKEKYGVVVPEDDVVACHRLKNSVLLKIWRRTEDSAWSKLMPLIKSKPVNDFNLYANFQMTPRRGALMYQIRQQRDNFKQKGQPFKLFSDENGSISVQFFSQDVKVKLTYNRAKGSSPKTFNQKELNDLFDAQK